jgi:glycosyltransferase involved in cell wall biosynthesis
LAALEAMAWGVPVISSNSGGLSEVNFEGISATSAMLGIQTKWLRILKILKDSTTLQNLKKMYLS